MPSNLFTTEYLFATTAPTNKITFAVLLGAFAVFAILALLTNLSRKIQRSLRCWLFNYFLTIGIVGILISFFRWQSIPYLGTRLAMFIVIVSAIVWYCLLVGYVLIKMPKEVRRDKDEEIYQKYLPKKKTK